MIKERGVSVDGQVSSDLRQIIEDCSEKVSEEFPEGSLPRMFWEQQLK